MTTLVDQQAAPAAGVGYRTIAAMAWEWAENSPERVAMREKDFGIWQEITWSEFWDSVLDAAHGLLALGLDPGARVSIQSEDRPEWVILDLATVAVRGITVGLYPTNPAAEVQYLLSDSGAEIHLAEDQEQTDKVMAVIETLPNLRKIIHVEPRGFRSVRDDHRFVFWDDFLEMGRSHRESNPGAVEHLIAEATEDDVLTLVYTSGTTGPPKGAMLTHGNVTYCLDVLVNNEKRIGLERKVGPDDILLTYLPLCHVAERIFSTWTLAGNAPVLNFAESIETVQQNLREIQPTIFFSVPRIWEKIHAGILIRLNDATLFKKLFARPSMSAARYIGKTRVAEGGDFTLTARVLYWIFNLLYFRSLKERIGLRHCRYAASGAAPIAPEVLEFFMGLGIPIYELYGMTENTAVATTNFPGSAKVGTVGEPYLDGILRIDEETGEIQTKHPGVFKGYWSNPEKTAEAFTEDGWLRTGDVGIWVDGTHVKIVDRMKDVIITSGGKNVSPSEVENSLKVSPFVKEAMVIGDGRNYLTAMIGIEMDVVGDWATRRGIPYTTYRDLSEKPDVIELIQGVVDETNSKFARAENIRKFRLIPKELDHEDGELTATQKLKRSAMANMFGDLIEDMYRS
ncbi:MAG TPA: AMP-binding protein [Acidimicrobiia bacterium]|nr:AMP-binding protein [Acidimicrobiia bacterium]